MAAGAGDDAVERREAEPGALARRLGGEERLEHAGEYLGGNAGAGVGDPQPGVAAGFEAGPVVGVGLVHGDVRGVDGELPAAGHRVAGVDCEVDQDLLELAGVRLDRPQAFGGCGVQGDVLAEGAAQQLIQARDDVVEAEYFGVHDVAAGEDQQLAGQPYRPLRRAADLLDVAEHVAQPRILARQARYLLLEHVGEAGDHVQQVVEVVRDPADELAEAFHPLGMPQPVLRRGPLGIGAHHVGHQLGVIDGLGAPLGQVGAELQGRSRRTAPRSRRGRQRARRVPCPRRSAAQ